MAKPSGMPVLKQEPVEEIDVEKIILDLCQKNPDGIDNKIIEQALPHCDVQQRVAAINKLLTTGFIDLLQIGQRLLYRLKDTAGDNQLKGADAQEKLVYQIIKEADNKGIWIRDIRSKSNLPLTQLNKVLKNLENKELIKAVKSVAAPKKKVYMLFNLEPDSSVTGGAWYSDQDFESELVDLLNQQCYKFLEQKAASAREQHIDPISQQHAATATAEEVLGYITQLRVVTVQLKVEDIVTILNTLIFDGKITQSTRVGASGSRGDSHVNVYRVSKPLIETTGLMRMPCGTCPVSSHCHEGGAISPGTCVYMRDWLEL